MRVLVDTDVVLDLMLKRPTFYHDAFALWRAGDQGRYERFIAAITPVNAYYIARKFLGAASARQAISDLLTASNICAIDEYVLTTAHSSPIADFEDAVQIYAAVHAGMDVIVTRNGPDYAGSPIPVLTPADLLARLAHQTP
jgi:predicted nucleic acid-binding protein